MISYNVEDMVLTLGPGGNPLSINFEVKATPLVQARARMNTTAHPPYLYDPSRDAKQRFANGVRSEMQATGHNTFPFFDRSTAIRMTAKFVLPRPKNDFKKNKALPLQLATTAGSFPRGKDIDNLVKFVADALQDTLYMNDTNIVRVEAEKTYSTDISEGVGWTELEFTKVVCFDPPN
jgi:Holliday junction resolvase RusA-like endonuclease